MKNILSITMLAVLVQIINGQAIKEIKTMENEMKSLSPNLMVNDVNQTLDYYINTLGFKKVMTVPDSGNLVWAMVKSGSVTFMFQEKNNIKSEYPQLNNFEQGGGLTFYITVTNVQKLNDSLKDRVKIAKDLNKTFYGATEFAIEDINGYILTFSEPPNNNK